MGWFNKGRGVTYPNPSPALQTDFQPSGNIAAPVVNTDANSAVWPGYDNQIERGIPERVVPYAPIPGQVVMTPVITQYSKLPIMKQGFTQPFVPYGHYRTGYPYAAPLLLLSQPIVNVVSQRSNTVGKPVRKSIKVNAPKVHTE